MARRRRGQKKGRREHPPAFACVLALFDRLLGGRYMDRDLCPTACRVGARRHRRRHRVPPFRAHVEQLLLLSSFSSFSLLSLLSLHLSHKQSSPSLKPRSFCPFPSPLLTLSSRPRLHLRPIGRCGRCGRCGIRRSPPPRSRATEARTRDLRPAFRQSGESR